MRVLGIDPGLQATGYGLVEVDEGRSQQVTLLEAGTVEPDPNGLLHERVHKIYKNLDDIILQYTPDMMVLEKLYAHYRHPTTACLLGHVRGVILLLGSHRGLRVAEHSVKRIRKALLGNGSASKEQVRDVVAHIFKIKAEQLTLDASDALALALGYIRMGGEKSLIPGNPRW